MLWSDPPTGTVASWSLSSLVILASYFIGCLTSGYYLVRLRGGGDIRNEGSGSAGATNVGRALGSTWFVATFFLDMIKGAFAAWLAVHFDLGPWARLLSMLAAVVGHIFPVQLGFRGGKGVATLTGVILVVDYRILLVISGIFIIALVPLRRFTLSGLLALAVSPLVLAFQDRQGGSAVGLLILLLPVLYAHRDNLREDLPFLQNLYAGKTSANQPTSKD